MPSACTASTRATAPSLARSRAGSTCAPSSSSSSGPRKRAPSSRVRRPHFRGMSALARPPSRALAYRLGVKPGEVSEWLKERDWKSRGRVIPASRVRIPPSPLKFRRPASAGLSRLGQRGRNAVSLEPSCSRRVEGRSPRRSSTQATSTRTSARSRPGAMARSLLSRDQAMLPATATLRSAKVSEPPTRYRFSGEDAVEYVEALGRAGARGTAPRRRGTARSSQGAAPSSRPSGGERRGPAGGRPTVPRAARERHPRGRAG